MTRPDATPGRGQTLALFLMLIAGLVAGVVVTTVAAIGLFMHRTETVHTYPQSPPGGYAAAVKRIHSPMDIDRYEIWLGPSAGDDVPRGHVVAIPLAWSTEPRIDWTPDTVVLSFEPGGEIRVPMTMVLDKR
ncbi:hypothetical protein [Nocardia sp. N2S4-5]|uniref:hypothetical protein n=1 Tax=Nocardia sp. N2S4-5 TaxID=3351565 RepID=UPI0037D107BB